MSSFLQGVLMVWEDYTSRKPINTNKQMTPPTRRVFLWFIVTRAQEAQMATHGFEEDDGLWDQYGDDPKSVYGARAIIRAGMGGFLSGKSKKRKSKNSQQAMEHSQTSDQKPESGCTPESES
jgi:hypothetical protein